MGCEIVLKSGERAAVLHEFSDKEWLYVQAYNYIGWAKTEDVAFCTADEWMSIGENSNWLMVTGNRILLDYSNINAKVLRRELTMDTRLMLLKDKPAVIDGISTVSSYVVLLPTRDKSGKLELTETRVPQGLDVTEGFLEYTPRNVLELAQNASNQAAVAGKWVDVSDLEIKPKGNGKIFLSEIRTVNTVNLYASWRYFPALNTLFEKENYEAHKKNRISAWYLFRFYGGI